MLREAFQEVLAQVELLIKHAKPVYNTQPELADSPVGKHVRHIVDHLWAFQQGINKGCVDYNLRHRESTLEQDPELAHTALATFMQWLKHTAPAPETFSIISEISVSHSESIELTSTLDRELLYLINHTLHHIALAKLVAKSQGVEMPEHLGVAPATASYYRQERKAVCAQ